MTIQFAKANIGDEEIKAVESVMRSGWLTRGKICQQFEEEFAEYVGAKYAISLNSCTAALFLALKYKTEGQHYALNNIAVPSFTFTASASIIKHCGLKIKFWDVNKDNYCLKEDQYQEGIDGVVAVHLTGNKCSTNKFKNKYIIEDSAHRILPKTQGKNPVCYSFYATKNMTTGEGGMLTTNDKEMADWVKKAMLHGSSKDGFNRYANKGAWKYSIDFTGWKCNMTDLAAAIGIVQLRKLNQMNARRQFLIDLYNKYLGYNNTGLHLYPIFVKERDIFFNKMMDAGIHCSCHFLSLHNQPAYIAYSHVYLPNTEILSGSEISLPLYPDLKEEEVKYICEKVLETGLLISKKELENG